MSRNSSFSFIVVIVAEFITSGRQIPKAEKDAPEPHWGDPSCWAGDFTWRKCCSGRFDKVVDCWSTEFTKQRCCYGDSDRSTENVKDAGLWDYIVVGAGAAGSVLTARLLEAGWSVLLLEEGPVDSDIVGLYDDVEDTVSREYTILYPLLDDSDFFSHYHRGWGLGGSVNVNNRVWSRGFISEYAAWSVPGWDEDRIKMAFQKLERYAGYTPPGLGVGMNITRIGPRARNSRMSDFLPRVIEAFEGRGVPFNPELRQVESESGVGGYWYLYDCHKRPRVDTHKELDTLKCRSKTPYSALVGSQNWGQRLTVRSGWKAWRVNLEKSQDGEGLIANGVLATNQNVTGSIADVELSLFRAKREVVLAAGVFGSPQLLQVSGIGPSVRLKELGIEERVNSENVGAQVHDVLTTTTIYRLGTACSCEIDEPLGPPNSCHLVNQRHPKPDGSPDSLMAFYNVSEDFAQGLGNRIVDIEAWIDHICYDGQSAFFILLALLRPQSRGNVQVISPNVSQRPYLDFKVDSRDIVTLDDALLWLEQAFQRIGLTGFMIGTRFVPEDHHLFRAGVYAKGHALSHPLQFGAAGGSVALSASLSGALDLEFRVRGVHGLRVSDTSAIPQPVGGHGMAPATLIGEMVADLMLKDSRQSQDHSSETSITLKDGSQMPLVGLGTASFEYANPERAVLDFIRLGGRLIDAAVSYKGIHEAIAKAVRVSMVPRRELFLQTKILPTGYNETIESVQNALSEFSTGYLDAVLLHVPGLEEGEEFGGQTVVPGSWPLCVRPGNDWRSCRLQSWLALEFLQSQAFVRSIGVSNFLVHHIEELMAHVSRPPTLLQMEVHPWWYQRPIIGFCRRHGIVIQAYASLGGSLGMQDEIFKDEFVTAIAKQLQRSPAQILLRWAMQQNIAVIPGSSKPKHMRDNLDAVNFELTHFQMAAIGRISEEFETKLYRTTGLASLKFL